jgi:hypothetical protein
VLMNVLSVLDWAARAETGPYEEPLEWVGWVLVVGDEVFGAMHGDGVLKVDVTTFIFMVVTPAADCKLAGD